MARILMGPFSNALIVESPHTSLDGLLAQTGIKATRLAAVPDASALIDAIRKSEAHVLFKRSRVPVTEEVLAACPSLHAVQLCCIGDDSVDKDAAANHGVLVFNDPVSNARSVVELALGQLIALSRRLYETDQLTHDGRWDKSEKGRFEIAGKTLGIVGLGNIGRQVARATEALGVRVQFFDTRPVSVEIGQEMGWKSVATLRELMRTSDMVTVHTSARDYMGHDNAGLLDDVLGEFGADLPDQPSPRIFLNIARGNLHSSEALLNAVQSGAIRYAAIDVYPHEPRPSATWENPYGKEPRIVCTPHIGAATSEAQPRIASRVARTIADFSRFGRVRDCVFGPRVKLRTPSLRTGQAVLMVVHSTARGTKKAVADAIYEAEASTLASIQEDFPGGVAYDLAVLDKALPESGIAQLVERAASLAGDPRAIRAVRQVVVEPGWMS